MTPPLRSWIFALSMGTAMGLSGLGAITTAGATSTTHARTVAQASLTTGGTWSLSATPKKGGQLLSISCISATNCWAVGDSFFHTNPQTLIAHSTAFGWAVVASPNVGTGGFNYLYSVSCPSSTDCWAVGEAATSGIFQTLIEHYNGSTWAIVSSPNGNVTVDNRLSSVACASASYCISVGEVGDPASPPRTLIEQYNGTTWAVVASPNVGSNVNALESVRCVGTSDCWAVGYYSNGANARTLIEQYNGSAWAIVSSPNTAAAQDNYLTDVTCVNAADCWTVGESCVSISYCPTLIGHYNGSGWAIVSSPDPGSISNTLDGVTCVGADECWAVGYQNSGVDQTLVEHFDGSAWTVANSPNTSSGEYNDLQGVNCADANDCAAVGFSLGATFYQGLVEQYSTTTFQESNVRVAYDSWRGLIDPTADGGTYEVSRTKGATATFKFFGTGLYWETRKGPSQGVASVRIDGVNKGNVDLYAASSQNFSQGYSGLTSKNHTIVITVTGTKDALSGNANVAVDAFIVGFTTTQEASPTVTYDGWTGATSPSASGGTYRTDGKAKATSSLAFTGTGVTWVTATGPSEGKATVTVDGSVVETVDLYSPTVAWQVAEAITGLTSGSHTITITVLGTKDAVSAGTQVVVDAFIASW